MLKHGILGLLHYGSMTGYEIKTVFHDSLNYFWVAQTSQIYRELQMLKQNEWVEAVVIPQQGKPDKKVFSITSSGEMELLRWLTDDEIDFGTRIPILMRVFLEVHCLYRKILTFFRKSRKRVKTLWKK